MGLFSDLYQAVVSTKRRLAPPVAGENFRDRVRRTAADEFQTRKESKQQADTDAGLSALKAKITNEAAQILESLGKPQQAAMERDLEARREQARAAERRMEQTPEGQFIAGKRRLVYGRDFSSTNPSKPAVYSVWWEPEGNHFFVHFFDNSIGSETPGPVYRYGPIPEQEARMMYRAFSKGIAVWDYFRVRGSKTAHKRKYVRVSG